MIRKLTIALVVMAALVITVGSTLAANPHVVGSLSSSGQFTVTGKIAGLGNGYSGTQLTATADVTFDVQCSNSQGKLAPGQQGGTGSVNGSGAIDSVDKNGTYTFHVTFNTPSLSPAKAYGCPNNQWTASATNTVFTLTSLTLSDGTQIAL